MIALGVAAIAATWTLGWLAGRPTPPPPPPVFISPTTATTAAPWTNSLGMKFVPAGGKDVLFSVWETRRSDYASFAQADRDILPEWRLTSTKLRKRFTRMQLLTASGWHEATATWREPGFPQTLTDPATGITQLDSELFCAWLTIQERKEGRLTGAQHYRLPTAAEWTAAFAEGPANTAGDEARIAPWPTAWPTLAPRDDFPRTAPAGSFPAAANGLFDMGGNVSEWTSTETVRIRPGPRSSVAYRICGASWVTGALAELRPEFPRSAIRFQSIADVGFRCVLDLGTETSDVIEEESQ